MRKVRWIQISGRKIIIAARQKSPQIVFNFQAAAFTSKSVDVVNAFHVSKSFWTLAIFSFAYV
jgi:hypothetical protein